MLYQCAYNMITNNLIFIIVLIVLCVLFNKYFSIILKKYNPKLLIDDQFEKPREFSVWTSKSAIEIEVCLLSCQI